jgi:hypothetical protein
LFDAVRVIGDKKESQVFITITMIVGISPIMPRGGGVLPCSALFCAPDDRWNDDD